MTSAATPSGWGGPSATVVEVWGPVTEAPGARLDLAVRNADYRGMTSDGIQMARGGGNITIRATVADTSIGDGIGRVHRRRRRASRSSTRVPASTSASGSEGAPRRRRRRRPSRSDVIRSRLEGCRSAGITFQNAPELERGQLRIRDSRLARNGLANLWVEAFPVSQSPPKGRLAVSVAGSDFVESPRGIVLLDPTRQSAESVIDLGGGTLGSPGRNRIFGNGTDVEVAGLAVAAPTLTGGATPPARRRARSCSPTARHWTPSPS